MENETQPGPLGAAPLAPVSRAGVEAVFAETGLPHFILDLRDLTKNSAVSAWLAKPRLHRMIGAVYGSIVQNFADCAFFQKAMTNANLGLLLQGRRRVRNRRGLATSQ